MTDRTMIAQTAALFLPTGTTTELRMLDTPRDGTVSGYFQDQAAFVTAAAQWSGKAPGVYATLNPCQPALLARAANRLKPRAKATTADTDIVRRVWLPLDFDPVRPAGISSTDAEHAMALQRAADCTTWLSQCGWPAPVCADSGNGAHRLYHIDLPNDKTSCDLLERCLQAMALHFSDDAVKLDTGVFNAARIWKVYGTLACKGDSLPERPHRLARLLDVPSPIETVSRAQLEALAALVPVAPPAPPRARSAGHTSFDLERWIVDHGLSVAAAASWGNGGQRWALNPCPWNGAHTNKSAFIVQFASGAIAAGCHHNGCQGHDWESLRKQYEPDWTPYRDRSPTPPASKGHATTDTHERRNEHTAPPPRKRAVRVKGSTLLAATHEPLAYVVEEILPAGCALLTGKSKDGKSLMAYNLAVAVLTGNKALGMYQTMQGSVWYLALEDGERRAQKRLRMQEAQFGGIPADLQDKIEFTCWEAPRLGEGLEEELREWIEATPDARLIIIDILEKVRPRRTPNGNIYTEDYQATAPLSRLAEEHNVAILIVHHANKLNAADFRDSVSGATSLMGGADTTWSLARLPCADEATLRVTGRDIDEARELAMHFQDGFWTVLGDAAMVRLSKEREAILEAIQESAAALSPTQIATCTGKNVSTVRTLLQKLLRSGVVFCPTEGRYTLSTTYRATRERPAPPHLPVDETVDAVDGVDGVDVVDAVDAATLPDEPVYGASTGVYGASTPDEIPQRVEIVGRNGDSVYASTASTPVMHNELAFSPDCMDPPCYVCRGTVFWRNEADERVCARCHPQPTHAKGAASWSN